MLRKVMDGNEELYGVYYVVFGSLAGDEHVVKDYLWGSPYADRNSALNKCQELRNSHQGDQSFVVRKYVE